MAFTRETYTTREEWLKARGKGIGGSDASCVVGLNPYKTNLQLWQEKKGIITPECIDDKPQVIYGKLAEKPIREIFALDYAGLLELYHRENETLVRVDKPYLRASLDGELLVLEDLEIRSFWKKYFDKDVHDEANIVPEKVKLKQGMKGVFEVKTTEVLSSMQKEWWHNAIPNNYFCQTLHGLVVTDYDFVILRAQLKWSDPNDVMTLETRDYCFLRSDRLLDLEYLENAEDKFWEENIVGGIEPPLLIKF